MKTTEVAQSRSSIVSNTLKDLTEQTRQWRTKIDLLEAGQKLDRAEALADLNQLLDVCQNLRDAILSEDAAASWRTKDELHTVVSKLDDAAAKRQRYLDLSQRLSAGTINHRRERTKTERLRQRDAAVAELVEISGQAAPPELPGPAADKWLEWACSLEDSIHDSELKILNTSFPRIDDFVRQLEIETWQDGPAAGSGHKASASVTRAADASPTRSLLEHHTSTTHTDSSGPSYSGPSSNNGGSHGSAVETLTAPVIEEATAPAVEPPVARLLEAYRVDAQPASAPVQVAAPAPVPPAPAAAATPTAQTGKVAFFDAEEIASLSQALAESMGTSKKARKVRSLLAVSHWLTPRDQNPILHPKCGVRAQIAYAGSSDLSPATPEEAENQIKAEDGLLLFTGGADLLRWSLTHRSEKLYDEIASVRRWTPEQMRAWFSELFKIELAEPQVQDMYKLTAGIPLLVGEMHRRIIPIPEQPPTWLGFAIWTRVKMGYEQQVPSIAKSLRDGADSVRLTEREIELLKMIVIASDDPAHGSMAANLRENWHQFKQPNLKPLSNGDEDSLLLLQGLGLIPMRQEVGLKPAHALLPLDHDDPIRQIVSHL